MPLECVPEDVKSFAVTQVGLNLQENVTLVCERMEFEGGKI